MILRSVFKALGAARRDIAHALSNDLTLLRRVAARTDRRIARDYLATHSVRKLHLGSGTNILPGWLNSNFFPRVEGQLHLDARGRFPFEDGQFDVIFSEHMIEHLAYPKGASMLKECCRVLKPGGRLRISTPDLAFLLDLGRRDRSALQDEYVRWAARKFSKDVPDAGEAFVINNFVRRWGHLFIYDEKTLRAAFAEAGFSEIVRCALNESVEPSLSNLEHEGRMPPGFLRLESMTIEGIKPRMR